MELLPPSDWQIFRSDFQTFILIFPDHSGVGIEELRGKIAAGKREEFFGGERGVLERVIVVAGLAALAVVPVRDGVNGFVLLRPDLQRVAMFSGNFLERQ